jgi:hypothetical protein
MRRSAWIAIFVSSCCAFASSLASFACSSDDGTARTSKRTVPPAGAAPEPIFRELESDLIKTCGGVNGTCHVRGSYQQAPAWLGGPDPYATIKKYRGILPSTKEVGDSILLTQVRHAGPALADAPDDLFGRVSDWLLAEVPGPPLPNTGAFSIQTGFNNVPLDTVASGFADARLNFLATETTGGTLTLSAVKITAPRKANLKIDSPFFVILPRSGKVKADPEVNGWKGELMIHAGESVELFSGKMILLRWDPTGRLKVAFNKVESSPGEALNAACTNLESFKTNALPAMNMMVDVLPDDGGDPDAGDPGPLGQSSCIGCHGKEPNPDEQPGPAVQAMDLRGAAADPTNACAEAKQWIDLKDRSKSVLLLNPTGKGNMLHPMKPVGDEDPIVAGLRAWIESEK